MRTGMALWDALRRGSARARAGRQAGLRQKTACAACKCAVCLSCRDARRTGKFADGISYELVNKN